MKRPSVRRFPPHHLTIVLAFTVSAVATACTLDTGEVDSVGGAAGSGALSGSGGTAGANATGGASAGTNATGGASAGTNATGGASAGTNATGGSGGTGGSNATGGSSSGNGGTAAGRGGMGSGGSNAAGTGGIASTGGSAGSPGSGGSGAAAGTSGEVPDEPYCAVTENWDPEYAAFEDEIVVLVNQYRAAGANCGGEEMPPVGPLTMDASLQCAARVHTKDMADRDFFDHDNPDGDGPSERMEEAGYDGRGWGENIAAGRDTPEETMEQWMDSPGHCSNIMADGFTLIGVGYYPGGEYGHLWTQTFGG